MTGLFFLVWHLANLAKAALQRGAKQHGSWNPVLRLDCMHTPIQCRPLLLSCAQCNAHKLVVCSLSPCMFPVCFSTRFAASMHSPPLVLTTANVTSSKRQRQRSHLQGPSSWGSGSSSTLGGLSSAFKQWDSLCPSSSIPAAFSQPSRRRVPLPSPARHFQ